MPSDTTTPPADPAALIDHAAIAKADADLAAAQAADRAAHQALDGAKKALAAATARADAAAASNGDLLTAEADVMNAEVAVRAMTRRANATAAAAAEAPRLHRQAVGQAHRSLAWSAIDRRHAACRAGEAARAALAAAEAEYLAATAELDRCANSGLAIPGLAHAGQAALRPEADEARFWRAHQVDVAGRRFYPGERVGETA